MSKDKILFIIPAYNEEASIQKTVEQVISAGYDYIVINDGSSDRTESILKDNNFNYVTLITNLGIGGAVQTGYKYARDHDYDIAIQFDADGQHNIKYIPDLIKPIKDGKANLTIGSCFIDKKNPSKRSSTVRRVGIRFLSDFIKLLSNKRIYDPTSGFRAADRIIISRFADNYPPEYPEAVSNFEILKSKSLKLKEVPVTMYKRTSGQSSIHSWKNIYASINVILSILILSTRRKHD